MDSKRESRLALGCGLLVFLAAWPGLSPAWWSPLLALWIPVAAVLLWRAQDHRPVHVEKACLILASFCGLFLLGGNAADPEVYLLRWSPAAGLALRRSGLFRFVLFTALLLPLLGRLSLRRLRILLATCACAAAAWCAVAFWNETGGAALYRDDHPSFLFRFWALARSLPSLAYYNPFWNAGRVETASVASGVPPLGLLFWPLWRFLPPHEVYTAVVAVTLPGLVPLLAAGAARLAGGGHAAAAAAALLALGSSRLFFKWALLFGTVPAVLSMSLIMPLCGLLIRLFREERPPAALAAGLAIALAALLAWPPGLFMALPLAAAVAVSWRKLTRRRLYILTAGAAGAGLLLLPGALALLHRWSAATDLLAATPDTPPWPQALVTGWHTLRGHLLGAHPLVLFLGLAGALCRPERNERRVFGVVLAGLLLLAGWGEWFKPQLQLTRAGIPLLLAAALPAALWLERLLEAPARALLPARAAAISLLALGVYAARDQYRNRSPTPYSVLGQEPLAIVDWIRDGTPEASRVVFAGATVHGYGRGHVAYLPVLAGRSMMACDYYHFSPRTHEYEYPPAAFRGSPEDIFKFFDLYNVSAALTFHDHWKRFFRKFPDRFEESASFGAEGQRVAFRLLRPAPGWFLRGSGSVEQRVNELIVRPDRPSEPCVIRFHWADHLRPDPPVRLRPFEAGYGVRFIELHPDGHAEIRLRFSSWRRGVRAEDDPPTDAALEASHGR